MTNIKFTKVSLDDIKFLSETRNLVAEEFLHDSRKFSYEESLAWFKETNPEYWMIWVEYERVGYFRLTNFSKSNRNMYIGADIHPDHQGKGYAHQAYLTFVPGVFVAWDLHKVSLEVLATNQRAINLYKKLGFVEEGRKREEVLKGDIYVDSIIMSILRNEWK
jgi:RimJ/RimL family protein N-acetyltransferase